jgi:flagellar basal body-associated protein FliL
MRAVILVLVVVVLLILAGLTTGYININQTRGAKAPEISATRNGVTAKNGQAPAFDVETGTVKVGSANATVKVPKLEVVPPQKQAAATTNNGQ